VGALDRYVGKIPAPFDIETLLDPDISKFEGADYSAPLVYKYFPPTRRAFFDRPQVRFSQREALNDPFEMTRRWKKISTEGLRTYLRAHMSTILPQLFSNPAIIAESAKEHFAREGISLSGPQVAQLEQVLRGEEGQRFLANQLVAAQALSAVGIDHVFAMVESQFDQIVSDLIAKFGVLSLTEDPMSQLMWAHYASSGTGFVVGFYANHSFFHASKDAAKNVLRKVTYTDDRTENFWSNPYFLFLVKNKHWEYEREWRMLKDLAECDVQVDGGAQRVFLCNVPAETIRSVHFGYGYDLANAKRDIDNLRMFGSSATFFTTRVNHERGALESEPIS
jgi:hypothetical protein